MSERALRLVRPRRAERTRVMYRTAELQIPIPVVSEIRNVPASVGMTEENGGNGDSGSWDNFNLTQLSLMDIGL